MANYHPNNELLMRFAAGQLPNALGVIVACHVEKCPQCQQQVRSFEQIGGELLAKSAIQPVSEGLLNNIMDQLDTPETLPVQDLGPETLPRPLRRFVKTDYAELPWTGLSKSIREYEIAIHDPVYKAKFYKIAAGKELPEHTHLGHEYTYVVQGSFSDRTSKYAVGDFILADTQTVHQPKASMEQDCICFAVLDAPLKMTGFFGRMLNPFLR